MSEIKARNDFLMEVDSSVLFRGVRHEVKTYAEPVFSGDEAFALSRTIESHRRAMFALTNLEEELGA